MSIRSVDLTAGRSWKPLDITFMLANAIGIAIYLKLASNGWRNPEEYGMIPVTAEPFLWAFALPVGAVCLVANLVWGGLIFRSGATRRWLSWLFVAGLWVIALCVDFAHH